jgi:uncharacterized membrane protein YvbJ
MSQILNALRKIQQSRQHGQMPQAVENDTFVADTPSNNHLMLILAISTVVSVLISIAAVYITLVNVESGHGKVLGLENTVKIQDKRISDFIVAINKNQKFTDTQINDISARLKNETASVDVQLNQLTSSSNDHYTSLKAAVLDDKQGIDILNNYARELNQKIETIAASNVQAKDIISPSTAN